MVVDIKADRNPRIYVLCYCSSVQNIVFALRNYILYKKNPYSGYFLNARFALFSRISTNKELARTKASTKDQYTLVLFILLGNAISVMIKSRAFMIYVDKPGDVSEDLLLVHRD